MWTYGVTRRYIGQCVWSSFAHCVGPTTYIRTVTASQQWRSFFQKFNRPTTTTERGRQRVVLLCSLHSRSYSAQNNSTPGRWRRMLRLAALCFLRKALWLQRLRLGLQLTSNDSNRLTYIGRTASKNSANKSNKLEDYWRLLASVHFLTSMAYWPNKWQINGKTLNWRRVAIIVY